MNLEEYRIKNGHSTLHTRSVGQDVVVGRGGLTPRVSSAVIQNARWKNDTNASCNTLS